VGSKAWVLRGSWGLGGERAREAQANIHTKKERGTHLLGMKITMGRNTKMAEM
jgi:hypothetical protein